MYSRLRLRRSEDFARLRERGRTVQNRWMLVSVLPNDLSHNRYGFVTAKRLGTAVQRNRVRRLMREAVRLRDPDLPPGFDLVLVARAPLVEQPFASVRRTVDDLFKQSGLLSA